MVNKQSNVPYDQIPHIVINHPDTNPEHQSIMRALYKILKDKKKCVYSNEALIKECRISERTLRRRLDELESWGFINRVGKSYARRFSLGLLFNTTAIVAGSKLHTPAKSTETTAKSDLNTGHGGRYTKPYTNLSTNNKNLSVFEKQQIEFYNSNKQFSVPEEYKYLFK